MRSSQIDPLYSDRPLQHQAPTTNKLLFTLLNILLTFLVSNFYINTLPQHHNLQERIIAGPISVRGAVFTMIASLNWLSKPLDNETIITATSRAMASLSLRSSTRTCQQATTPTEKTLECETISISPRPEQYSRNQVGGGQLGWSDRRRYEGAAWDRKAN